MNYLNSHLEEFRAQMPNMVKNVNDILSFIKEVDCNDSLLNGSIFTIFSKVDPEGSTPLLQYEVIDGKVMSSVCLVTYGNYYHTYFQLGFALACSAYDSVSELITVLRYAYSNHPVLSKTPEFQAIASMELIHNKTVSSVVNRTKIKKELVQSRKTKTTNAYILSELNFDYKTYVEKNYDISPLTVMCHVQAANQLGAVLRFLNSETYHKEIKSFYDELESNYSESTSQGEQFELDSGSSFSMDATHHRKLNHIKNLLSEILSAAHTLNDMETNTIEVPEDVFDTVTGEGITLPVSGFMMHANVFDIMSKIKSDFSSQGIELSFMGYHEESTCQILCSSITEHISQTYVAKILDHDKTIDDRDSIEFNLPSSSLKQRLTHYEITCKAKQIITELNLRSKTNPSFKKKSEVFQVCFEAYKSIYGL